MQRKEHMRDFRDAKAMAQTLRQVAKDKSISLTHSESLELVARILGLHDWNELAATIQSERRPPAAAAGRPPSPAPAEALPTVPLRDIVLFPQMTLPIFVGRDPTKRAIERAFAGDKLILAVTQKRPDDDNPTLEGLYRVGIVARVIHQTTLLDGALKIYLQALERASIRRFVEGEFLSAEITKIEERSDKTADVSALSRQALEAYQAYANVDLDSLPQILTLLPRIREPGLLADTLAQLLKIDIDRRQELLETVDAVERLEKILALMRTDQKAA
jgi:uncharacterized protein